MQEIRFQLISADDNTPLPTVYTALVKPGESFENGNSVTLRRCKDMIIGEGDQRIQPRRIDKHRDGTYHLVYGWPRGKSWSQGSMFAPINVVEIE